MPKKAAASASTALKPATADPSTATDGIGGLSFEQAIGELETIVDGMEAGELSLQDALASYQRGAALVGRCRESLEAVAQQVQVLEEGLLRPLTPAARSDAGDDS